MLAGLLRPGDGQASRGPLTRAPIANREPALREASEQIVGKAPAHYSLVLRGFGGNAVDGVEHLLGALRIAEPEQGVGPVALTEDRALDTGRVGAFAVDYDGAPALLDGGLVGAALSEGGACRREAMQAGRSQEPYG